MKKQLLTTTALVAAGVFAVSGAALAQKPTLSLGGGTEQIFGVGEDDNSFSAASGKRVGFDQHSETEVHFNGAVTLDNGIKIRTRVELEGNSQLSGTGGGGANGANAAGNQDDIDENWMRISGSFGEVRLGSGDAAAQAMTTGYLGTWAVGVGQNFAFDTGDWVTSPGVNNAAGVGFNASTIGRVDLSSDAEHISYFTPRFAGFQAGLSYIPAANEDFNNQRELKTADTDGWSLGLNFDRKFGGIGVGIAGGYTTFNESTANRDDPEAWGIAGRVDFAGFRVAMSWVENIDQSTALSANANGQETFEAGGRYTFGPNAVSLQYQKAESKSANSLARDGDEIETFWLAYRRTLGPGVSWKVSAIFADYEDGQAGIANRNNDGQALTTSIAIRF